jgi:protein SCO1/2
MSRGGRAAGAVLALIVSSTSLTACGSSGGDSVSVGKPEFATYQGALLSKPLTLPATSLRATDGTTYDLGTRDRGTLRLVFFGYTHCPDTCPTTMSDIAVALRKVPAEVRSKTKVIFVTTDPRRDTVAAMREWLGRFDKDFVGLTGTPAQISATAAALSVPLLKEEKNASGGYDIPHGAQVIAVTPDDKAHLIWLGGTQVRQYRSDIERLLADPAYGGVK